MTLATAAPERVVLHGSVLDVHVLCELLRKCGLDPAEYLTKAGISPRLLTQSRADITRRQEIEFHTLFAAATSDHPEIWVESGHRHGYTAWGEFGMANITAPTLRHIRHLAETLGGGAGRYPAVGHDRSLTGVAVTFDLDFARGTPGFEFQVVREVITGVDLYNELWGARFPFAYIEVPADVSKFGLSAHIDAPIRYGDGPLLFLWPLELDDVPLPRGDALLHSRYVAQLDRVGRQRLSKVAVEEDVREVLSQMSDASPGLDEVAESLGMTGRTLQRRLAERGFAFRTLRENSRLGKAKWMLRESDTPISEIAWRLGYVETSSFSHAFRRWAGESPRSYRQRSATGEMSAGAA